MTTRTPSPDQAQHTAGVRATDIFRCHVCNAATVIAPEPPEKAVCHAHCPDHYYIYERGDGHRCENCGQAPPHDWYVEDERW